MPTEVVVDQKPMALPPVDPNVRIPDAVKKRVAAVEALYTANGTASDSAPTPPSPPEVPKAQAVSDPVTVPPNADLSPPPAQPEAPQAPKDQQLELPFEELNDTNDPSYRRRFLSLQGRMKAREKAYEEMQKQMTQLGDELMYAQQATSRAPSAPPPATPNFITDQDVQNYGSDLVDFTQRAAAQYVAPHLQRLERENEQLRRQQALEARKLLDERVEQAVPNYREIDQNPRWHNWLRLPDMLSGRIRQHWLNEAIAAANAPRVISFFRQFLAEEHATGQLEPAQIPAAPSAMPTREPAIPLASLAAPGRSRPASGGDASMPPEKPIYTRAQIRDNYSSHRRGQWAGRETEWDRLERDMIAAAREGRVQF